MNKELEFAIEKAKASIAGMEDGTMTYKQADIIAKNARTIVYSVATDLRERMFVANTDTAGIDNLNVMPPSPRLTQAK